MATGYSSSSNWSLCCRKCRRSIVTLNQLKLTLLGSAGIHVNLKAGIDLEDSNVIEKVQNPDPKKRERAPFKALCLGRASATSGECRNSLGSYMNNTLSFSANQVYFTNGRQEQQWKKWSEANDTLQGMGISVERRSTMSGNVAVLNCENRRPRAAPSPLVYCNVTLTSHNTITRLTRDKPRDYQRGLFLKAMEGNSLVYLPTGCGKTLIAAMSIACMSHLNQDKVAVFLAPKTPLVQQQFEYIKAQLPNLTVEVLTGDREGEDVDNPAWVKVLQSLLNHSLDVLVMSPDIFLNLLVDERDLLRITDVSLIVFDEAHCCQGRHPYAKIMDKYKAIADRFKPVILALSASPATAVKADQIKTELEKLLTSLDCRVIVPRPQDLHPYWNRPRVSYLLKEHNDYQRYLEHQVEVYLKSLNPYLIRLLGVTDDLENHTIQSCNYKGILRQAIMLVQNNRDKIKGLALGEHAMNVLSVLELNTVLGCAQACQSLRNVFVSVEQAGNPMDRERRNILTSIRPYHILVNAIERLGNIPDNVRSPSDRFRELLVELRKFAEKVRDGGDSCRGIVFVKMRKTCKKLCDEIREKDPLICQYLNPKRFVGHGKGTHGMEWKAEQEPVLKEFHSGKCRLLVSTSVLEEGLDVPACNLVIRFDSVMSMRALIQSRGRAARRPDSRFVIMCNNVNEMVSFKELETKEKNLDEVISEEARFGFASTRGCEVRKLDVKYCRASRKKRSPRKRRNGRRRRNRSAIPSVSIVVYSNGNQRSDGASSSAGRQGREDFLESLSSSSVVVSRTSRVSSGQDDMDVLRNDFQILSINRDASQQAHCQTTTSNETRSTTTRVHLRSRPGDHTHRNADQLFDDVVRTWCEAGPSLWLERDEKPADRNMIFHIVPIQEIAGGDFRTKCTFSELWRHQCSGGAEIVFLHDLKLVTIAFHNTAGVLHKIEIPYDQIHEFLTLSFPRDQEEFADIFFCVRHVPSLSAKTSEVDEDSEEFAECSFSEYYLRGYSDDENQAVDGDRAEAGNEDVEASGEMSDESAGEQQDESLSWQPEGSDSWHADYRGEQAVMNGQDLDYFPHQPAEIVDSSDESNSSSDSESDDDNSSFVGEEIHAIDELVKVKTWSRRVEIEDQKRFGKFLTLRVRLRYTDDLYDALKALKGFGIRFYYAPINIENQNDETHHIARFSPEIWYAHECLIGLHPNLRCRITSLFYNQLWQMSYDMNENDCINAIYQISSRALHDYFIDPEHELGTLLARGQTVSRACISRGSVPAHCALVRRLVFTPTRVIPFPAEVMEQNRVLRHYDADNFISVSIREEDYSKLRGNKASLEVVLEVIKGYMLQSLPVGGRDYDYVGCSNSQMRSHGCWFVQPSWRGNAEDIRRWMGDLSSIRCVASYMSRLGQCFSTSLDTIGITLQDGVRYREIDEVERNDFCFSDGIGTISPGLAREVCLKVAKPDYTSALQIRFAGCKGVLCVDTNLRESQVCIRPSMKKFESPHRRLELLQTSRPQAVYLNQQTIMLLSNLGVPDEIFLNLQKKMLDSLAAMMLNGNEALQRMSNIIRSGIDYKGLSDNGVALTTEPYFKSLMCALYKERIHRLLKKSRILLPVSEARLMMGVMDETGLLQAGQVFVQCSHMTSEGDENEPVFTNQRFIVEHSVVVTRNPCLHPGDVRELEAVDVYELHHLVDCIVFPQNGPRPHPNEMAGGDLDGDLYFVTWSDDFKPRREIQEPMAYPALQKRVKDGPITVQDMVDFYAEYIQCDALGIIDTAHKAHADLEEKGVESAKCLELAEKHSLAVDAPKTGMWPDTLGCKAKKHPDFMKVPNKPSYISHKVLGRLFREVRDFEEITNHVVPDSAVQLDGRLIFPGYEQYLSSAEMAYADYASQLTTLLTLYGIKTEGEMLSGCFHKLKGDFGRERSQVAFVVRKLIQQLRSDFRELFFKEFHLNGERLLPIQVTIAMKQKASAWYHYAYKPVTNTDHGLQSRETPVKRFVSFPWVVDDVLVTVLSSPITNICDTPASCSVTGDISRSILEIFSREAHHLLHDYRGRLELLDVIARNVSTQPPRDRIVMFGSSANFIFRPDSDLDLCVVASRSGDNRTPASQIQTLERLESNLRVCFGRVKLIKDAKVPVIRLGRLTSPRGSQNRLRLSCDISADRNGFIKTAVIVYYYSKYSWLLPLIRFVIQWAHITGLTQRLDGVLINTNVLVFMILSFCVQKDYIQPCSMENIVQRYQDTRNCQNERPEFFSSLIDGLLNNDRRPVGRLRAARLGANDRVDATRGLGANSCIGVILLEFFKNRHEILTGTFSENFRALLSATTFSELLNPEDVQTLNEQMQKAYHVLAIHGNGHALLDISSAQVQRIFTLSSLKSLEIAGERSERKYSRELTRKSGAFVTVRPQLPGSGSNLIAEARGTIGNIRVLERLLDSNKEDCLKNKVSAMSKCFVRGASMITFECCHSYNDHVKLVPYYGNHHQTHDQRFRHVPLLENVTQPPDDFQESHAFQNFCTKFLNQIKVVIRDYEQAVHGELEFVVHFGRIYAFDIPQVSYEDSEPMTVQDFQYSASKGKVTQREVVRRRPGFRRPGGGGGRSKPKAERKHKVKETKRDVDKSPNHSLFTVVSDGGMAEIHAYLRRQGYIEQPALRKNSYTVTVRKGTSDIYICYDERFNPTMLKLPRLRWFLADIKREWMERQNSPGASNLDGLECDVRFILGTSREFAADDFGEGDDENLLNILSPNPSLNPYPFIINNELQRKLQLIRYKETSVYIKPGHRTQVCLSKVKEFSRLRATNGLFRKMFERRELVIKPTLPANLENQEEVKGFLNRIWKTAFKFARKASA